MSKWWLAFGLAGCTLKLPSETGLTGDRDEDGALSMDDCDDLNPEIYPGAAEVCDGYDNDCDGDLPDDEDADWDADGLLRCADCNDLDADLGVIATYYRDADNDGYGSPALVKYDCDKPSGYVSNADDCDDGDPFSYPDQIWYLDYDADGHGNPDFYFVGCLAPAGTWVTTATDCDDTDPDEYPGQIWYPDNDADGFGSNESDISSCESPGDGYIVDGGDCNDSSSAVFPGQTWAPDADGDTYGDLTRAIESCGEPEKKKEVWVQIVDDLSDCDDTNPNVNPSEEEVCDLFDTDCNGIIPPDERDLDGDLYGICHGDSDDEDPSVYPVFTAWTGVSTNVLEADLVGWTQCWTEAYNRSGTAGASLRKICAKRNVMVACRERSSGVLTVAAHAPQIDVFTDVGSDPTAVHTANGVDWYLFANSGFGFLPEGSGVNRVPCDQEATIDSDKRLCWTLRSGNFTSGYRCGTNTNLTSSSWDRVIYHAD